MKVHSAARTGISQSVHLKLDTYRISFVFNFYYFSFNRFCGWIDAELSARGVAEATQAGKVQFFLRVLLFLL